MAISKKQKRFADEYLIDCNATQAAIRVGYSEKTAYSQGQRLLKKVEIKSYIEGELEKIHSEKVADTKEVMEYLTSVLRGESLAEIVVVEGEGEGCSSARNIKKGPDEKEKLKAAELLGKRFGIFSDKVKVEGAVPVVITDDIGDIDEKM
ncbi:MAG: terminase small subunit [Lachnospirales bacterium]